MLRVLTAAVLGVFISLIAAQISNAQTGALSPLQRVSIATIGTQGNGSSVYPSISADGRYVAFKSSATNLDPADNNPNTNLNHVYVYDRNQQILKHISQTTDPTQQWSFDEEDPSISADGRYVAFTSTPGDAAGGDQRIANVFVYDLTTDSVQRIAGTSQLPRMSADGRYVAFLLNDGPLGHLVLYDRNMNTTERISAATDGTPGNNFDLTAEFGMSPDARYFAFASYSSNLDPNQTNTDIGIFVRDRTLGVTTAISVSGVYNWASISGDGRYVVYSNLIYDRTTNTATQFSGEPVSGASVSGDGRSRNQRE